MTELQKSYGTLSDAQLANFVSLGDDRAFDELVVRYLDTISIIARKFSAEGYEHNDFVQEGLVGLLCSCKAFDQNGGASFKSYMSVIVERRFISIIRRGEQKKCHSLIKHCSDGRCGRVNRRFRQNSRRTFDVQRTA